MQKFKIAVLYLRQTSVNKVPVVAAGRPACALDASGLLQLQTEIFSVLILIRITEIFSTTVPGNQKEMGWRRIGEEFILEKINNKAKQFGCVAKKVWGGQKPGRVCCFKRELNWNTQTFLAVLQHRN